LSSISSERRYSTESAVVSGVAPLKQRKGAASDDRGVLT
jgi:hypothetical protein